MALRKFIIERDIPAVGSFEREQLRGAAGQSNKALRELGPNIQWVESYVAADKTFCVYLAKDEDIIRDWCHQSAAELEQASGPAVQSPAHILKDLPQRVAELHRVARLVYSEWTSRLPGPASRRAIAVNWQ